MPPVELYGVKFKGKRKMFFLIVSFLGEFNNISIGMQIFQEIYISGRI